MLTYPMAERGELSLYEFLYRCLRADIVSGVLQPDDKLPSKRSLAQNLAVSVITVEHAYEQLQSEGYVYSIEKKGVYVNQPEQKIPVIQSLRTTSLKPKVQTQKWFADFTGGEIPKEHFPIDTWAKSLRKSLRSEPERLLAPVPSAGLYELRQAIASHLMEYRGIETSPEFIIVGAGAENLYDRLLQLLGRGHGYATEDPGYQKFRHIMEASDVRCVGIPLDHDGLSATALKQSDTRIVHLSPSHQFPTGIVMPAGRREEILSWANSTAGRWVIEDDYDCELRLRGRPFRTMFSMDKNNRVIYMNTFSRTLSPSFRIAYMVLPPELLTRWQNKLSFYRSPVPNLEQIALADFIENGSFGRHINRMRTIYRAGKLKVQSLIRQSSMARHVEIIEQEAGLHFMLEIRPPKNAINNENVMSRLKQEALKQAVKISCLPDYRLPAQSLSKERNNGSGFFILINYTGISEENREEAVRRLSHVVCEVIDTI